MHRLVEEVKMSSDEDHKAQPGCREARPGGLGRMSRGGSTQQGLGKDAHSWPVKGAVRHPGNRGQGWGRGAGGDAGQGQDGAAQVEEREWGRRSFSLRQSCGWNIT